MVVVRADERWGRLVDEHRVRQRELEAIDGATRKAWSRGVVGGWIAVLAIGFLAVGMSLLGSSYLERERTGEGGAFFEAGFTLLFGGLLGGVAALYLLLAAQVADRRWAPVLRWAGIGVLLVVVVCAGVASWVVDQGGVCSGPCG